MVYHNLMGLNQIVDKANKQRKTEHFEPIMGDLSNISRHITSIDEEVEQLKRHIKILTDKNKLLEQKNKEFSKKLAFRFAINDIVIGFIASVLAFLLEHILFR